MRNPREFAKPLAIGAPAPMLGIPGKPARMIHFFDPSSERMVAELSAIATRSDIVLGNLENGVPVARNITAREGLVMHERGSSGSPASAIWAGAVLWTRVNALESP